MEVVNGGKEPQAGDACSGMEGGAEAEAAGQHVQIDGPTKKEG